MYYFLPHKLALLMLIILLGSSSIALKGEGYINAITKENIFTSKNILPVDKAFQLDIKIHDRKKSFWNGKLMKTATCIEISLNLLQKEKY